LGKHSFRRWLGKGCGEGLAIQLKFGENYRPVTLERIVYGYDQGKMNKFAFDSMLAKQAYDVYVKHGKCKPCIVFCSTRQDCQNTAKALLQAYQAKPGWSNAQLDLSFTDKGLATLVASGIAFHHAGLSLADRNMVEKLFRDNKLMILCSTSTLAVGVNLPAHLVILKNTLVYNNGSFEEYSDLDVLQMIGRAGRPQFDTTGCAIIMTDKRKQVMYEQLITGTEILESHLHLALLEHLNAEISSATIKSRTEAVDWLKKTFLYVRMKQNPAHYRLQEGQSADDILQDLCEKNITLLEEHKLVESRNGSLSPSPLGEIMANYYVRFSSFQVLVSLSDSSSQADILAALCKADEFSSLSMRSGDKGMLNLLKSLPGIRLPISSKVESLWQKIFLAAQIAPGCVDLSSVRAKFSNNVTELLAHDSTIRQHLLRLLSCLVDCKLLLKEATIINNALLLRQALASKCWNQSPAALKHIRGIGDASLRTLLHAGIRSVAQLKEAEPRELERLFKRHPPFGNKLIKDAEQLPSVSMKARLTNQTVKPDGVHLQFEVHIAAECAPFWRPETRLVNFTASTSGGLLLDFRRQRFDKLLSGKKITFDCCLTKYVTSIDFLMLCEDIICCQARQSWTLEVSASDFPEQASVAAEEDDDVWLEVIGRLSKDP
jgi:ATP-dependent DNA helicase HFM1/MER3